MLRMSIKPQDIMLLAGWLLAAPAMALTATNDVSGSNTYMFIDNDVDDEYFITTSSSPRASPGPISGRNIKRTSVAWGIWATRAGVTVTAILISGSTTPPLTSRFRAPLHVYWRKLPGFRLYPRMSSTKTVTITRCPATA
jgi:hypothetical protein